ncbi:MAG: nucleotidyltransferase family protein [Planctomycetota bacterium]|nr:nucleotidyltransferase family protein [Planctomycetota bacterium]MDA1137595.1 nucleotidyltransferase family protein [Planctomycetota bacterium]
MTRNEVIKKLEQLSEKLNNEYGVASLSLFGSVARGEAGETSDVDVLVEFNRPTGYFGLVKLQLYLEEVLGCSVDVCTPGGLKPRMREEVLKEAVRVA